MTEDNNILGILEKIVKNKYMLDILTLKRLSSIKKDRRQDYLNTLRLNKLERYVYTRLLNAYKTGKKVSTITLITELSQYYKVPTRRKRNSKDNDNESDLYIHRLKLMVRNMRKKALYDYSRSMCTTADK